MRQDLATWCLSKGINVEAYAPLTHGNKLQTSNTEFQEIMQKYNKSAAQILIKWSLQKVIYHYQKQNSISIKGKSFC